MGAVYGCMPVLTKELFSFNFFHEVRMHTYTCICICIRICVLYICVNMYLLRSTPALFLGCVPVLAKELFSFNLFHEVRVYTYICLCICICICIFCICECSFISHYAGVISWLRASFDVRTLLV